MTIYNRRNLLHYLQDVKDNHLKGHGKAADLGGLAGELRLTEDEEKIEGIMNSFLEGMRQKHPRAYRATTLVYGLPDGQAMTYMEAGEIFYKGFHLRKKQKRVKVRFELEKEEIYGKIIGLGYRKRDVAGAYATIILKPREKKKEKITDGAVRAHVHTSLMLAAFSSKGNLEQIVSD